MLSALELLSIPRRYGYHISVCKGTVGKVFVPYVQGEGPDPHNNDSSKRKMDKGNSENATPTSLPSEGIVQRGFRYTSAPSQCS